MTTMNPSDISILIVEPSDIQRRIITDNLKKQGVTKLLEAETITDALTIIEAHPDSLMISAMDFDEGTGLDLSKKIKADNRIADTSFILVSNEYKRETLEEFKQSGVTALLPNPFTHENIALAINTTVGLLSANELDLEYFDVHPIRVLLVDDSRSARHRIKRVLNNLGLMKVIEATDNQEAIKLMGHTMFHLIVTNDNTSEVDNRALTHYVRQKSQQSNIPILMVSIEKNDIHLVNIEQDGVNAFCVQPFKPKLVKQILYKLLGH